MHSASEDDAFSLPLLAVLLLFSFRATSHDLPLPTLSYHYRLGGALFHVGSTIPSARRSRWRFGRVTIVPSPAGRHRATTMEGRRQWRHAAERNGHPILGILASWTSSSGSPSFAAAPILSSVRVCVMRYGVPDGSLFCSHVLCRIALLLRDGGGVKTHPPVLSRGHEE